MDELRDILLKHEENRFSFGEINNRKFTQAAIEQLIAEEVRAARLDELNYWFRLRRNDGDLELRLPDRVKRLSLNSHDVEAIKMRIAALQAGKIYTEPNQCSSVIGFGTTGRRNV